METDKKTCEVCGSEDLLDMGGDCYKCRRCGRKQSK
jgi:ribosomal protein L37AE/L43A